mmetsp:Transcript_30594/g.40655  ORF Transcript_30594/g.40655 Transcript_30594/m.40655 type:complete len:148 (-) Transcript_30594:278-721(-)
MSVNVDSNHAGDCVTRRSRPGYIVYLNNAPIYWYSKKQGGIETSSFDAEFIALKQCMEYIRGLRYKLRMMGMPVEGPAFIFGDNQSVLANSSKPGYLVREGTAADEWCITCINTNDNVADLLTKPLGGGEKGRRFIQMILHHVEHQY